MFPLCQRNGNVIFEIVTMLKGDVETLCRGCQLLQPTVPSWQMKSNQGWNIKEKMPKIYLYLLIYNILRWQIKFIKKISITNIPNWQMKFNQGWKCLLFLSILLRQNLLKKFDKGFLRSKFGEIYKRKER